MQSCWAAIQKEFQSSDDSIDFQALECTLNKSDKETLDSIAVQLQCEEFKQLQQSSSLVKQRDDCVSAINKLRTEILLLETESSEADQKILSFQNSIDALYCQRGKFTKDVQRIQRGVSKQVAKQRESANHIKKKICRDKDAVRGKVLSRCAELLVLRAGQIVHAEHLEDLVEKKPCILANWKYDLKCKRKKILQLQVQQQQKNLESCNLRHQQMEERSCQIREKQRELKRFNDELDRIRHQKAEMDTLALIYTETLGSAGDLPIDVIQMKRFFQSLHGCDKKCSSVSVKLDAEQEKHWRKAFEIYELQKDLTQLHEQNFLLQRTLSEMEMDEKVLAIAVDADFPTVDTVKEGKCRAQPMFGDKEYVKAEKRSPIACRPNVLSPCRPQSNIDEWAGFIIPPGGEREGTPFEVFEQDLCRPQPEPREKIYSSVRKLNSDCARSPKLSCKRSDTGPFRKKEPLVKLASFLQSDTNMNEIFESDCTTSCQKIQIRGRPRSCPPTKRCESFRNNDHDTIHRNRKRYCSSGEKRDASKERQCDLLLSSGYSSPTTDSCSESSCLADRKVTTCVMTECPTSTGLSPTCQTPERESPLTSYDEERVLRESAKSLNTLKLPPAYLSGIRKTEFSGPCCDRPDLPSCIRSPCIHMKPEASPMSACQFKKPTQNTTVRASLKQNPCLVASTSTSTSTIGQPTSLKPGKPWQSPKYLVVNEYETCRPLRRSNGTKSATCKDWNIIAKNLLTTPKQRLYVRLAAQSPLRECEDACPIPKDADCPTPDNSSCKTIASSII